MDKRGFPTSLSEFQDVFPDDDACAKYLEKVRWPNGFTCCKCSQVGEPFRFPSRSSVVLRCRKCKYSTSLTAGTVMQSTHTPLQTWFWGAYLVTTQTPGQSALQFQRQLGLTRYETAFQILHKLRAGMVRPDRDTIGGEHTVETDDCLVGGRTRGLGGGVHNRATVYGAVEVRLRKDFEDRAARHRDSHEGGVPLKRLVYAGRIRLRYEPVPRNKSNAARFLTENVTEGTLIKTDAWYGYKQVRSLGYFHEPMLMAGDPEKSEAHLPLIHLVFSNLKTWLMGTHHGAIAHHHLQAYLNEFTFRFNRRFYPMTSFNSVLGLAARSTSATYEELYSGDWQHPAS